MVSVASQLIKLIPEHKVDIFEKDGLLMSSLPYYSFLLLLLGSYYFIFKQPWFLVALLYAIIPMLDRVFTKDYRNPNEAERKELENNNEYFRLCLFATLLLDWYIFFQVLRYLSSYDWETEGIYKWVGILIAMANANATQFTVSHEIYHKGGDFNRIIGTLHMTKNLYTHFSYEHLYGHHRNVSTPEDPASAPQYMTAYRFFWRSFSGTFKSVYRMQEEKGKSIFLNYAVLSVVSSIVSTVLVYLSFGTGPMIFFLLQGLISIFLLETINYIEHYGLRRKKLADGSYEKVTIRHSWNAPHRFTNYILFKLQRHSDHHENSLKPYQTLLSLNESPQMPHGYSLMLSMALVPKVWFRVMDPLVDVYKSTGNGVVKNETSEKAIEEANEFAVWTGLVATTLWGLSFLL
jgi:alkane 1-monooxygenase